MTEPDPDAAPEPVPSPSPSPQPTPDPKPAPDPAPVLSADEYQAAQAAEYGQFRAVKQIRFGGALAYNVGNAVPASNVEKYGYEADGLVERI